MQAQPQAPTEFVAPWPANVESGGQHVAIRIRPIDCGPVDVPALSHPRSQKGAHAIFCVFDITGLILRGLRAPCGSYL